MTDLLELMPWQWRVGDRIPHPRLGARKGGFVTITAHRSNNRHQNRFRVAWRAKDGSTGVDIIGNSTRQFVSRAKEEK